MIRLRSLEIPEISNYRTNAFPSVQERKRAGVEDFVILKRFGNSFERSEESAKTHYQKGLGSSKGRSKNSESESFNGINEAEGLLAVETYGGARTMSISAHAGRSRICKLLVST